MEESRSFPPSPPQTGQGHPEASLLSSLAPYGRSESITPLHHWGSLHLAQVLFMLGHGFTRDRVLTGFCTYVYDRDGLRNLLYICAKMADVTEKMLIYLSIFRCSLSRFLHYLWCHHSRAQDCCRQTFPGLVVIFAFASSDCIRQLENVYFAYGRPLNLSKSADNRTNTKNKYLKI